MKLTIKLIVILLIIFGVNLSAQDNAQLVAQCAANAGNVTYLKDFVVKLDAGTPGGKAPTAKFSMVLSKSTVYRFSICTSPSSEGEGVLQLWEMNNMLGSSFMTATGKDYPFFDFKCQKTGVYHVFISFKDGKPGDCVGILSFVKKL
ncbi:MAG: hypothetical protein JXJ22_07070 [Bacteroidales bacterium]|nr:hypothetical protein [Bacteroidales bacterium]